MRGLNFDKSGAASQRRQKQVVLLLILVFKMYRRGGGKKEQSRPAQEEDGAGGRYAELLVFGYASKLFRDDERANYHEQGKHLIPWMGDKNIMIDRSV